MTDPRTPNISPGGRLRHLPDCFFYFILIVFNATFSNISDISW